MNKVILSGVVCTEPKVNHFTTNDGKDSAVARYKLAVNRIGAKNSQNSDQQTADFPECVCFGGNAIFVEKYVQKGTKLLVSGRIQTGKYTNKDGNAVYTTEVIVDSHEFMGAKQQTQQTQNQGYQYQQTPQNTVPQTGGYMPQQNGYQTPPMPNPQYVGYQQTVTQPQMNQAVQTPVQNYGYQAPPMPPTQEQFMDIPANVESDGLPFN